MTPTPDDFARDLTEDQCMLMGPCPDLRITTLLAIARTACSRAIAAEEEVARLQAMIPGLCERIAGQSEVIALRAEKEVTND